MGTVLRAAGLIVAVYPRADKLRKQLKYAVRIESPLVIIAGPDELEQDQVTIKDLRNRTQQTLSRCEVTSAVKALLSDDSAEKKP